MSPRASAKLARGENPDAPRRLSAGASMVATARFEAPVDEEGEPWPPPTALVAVLLRLGQSTTPYTGQIVEVGPYYPTAGGLGDIFEVRNVYGFGTHPAGDTIIVYPGEMRPLNEATATYIDEVRAEATPLYDEDVYQLRDELSEEAGIEVTAASVAAWSGLQRARVREKLRLLREAPGAIESFGIMQFLQQLPIKP